MRPILLSLIYFTTVNSYHNYRGEKSHPKYFRTAADEPNSSSSSESEQKPNPINYVDEEAPTREKTLVNSYQKDHPKLLLTTFDDLLNYKSSSSSESDEKSNPLYYVNEKDIARAWASSCDKNAPLWCKRACKRALDLTCGDFPEQCTKDFKTTLIEDCRAECRFEFDSTFNYNSYVRPKPQKNGKNKNGKDKNGKDKNGKDKNGKDKNGKDKNGKDKNGKDKNGKDKNGKDKNGKHEDKKDDAKDKPDDKPSSDKPDDSPPPEGPSSEGPSPDGPSSESPPPSQEPANDDAPPAE